MQAHGVRSNPSQSKPALLKSKHSLHQQPKIDSFSAGHIFSFTDDKPQIQLDGCRITKAQPTALTIWEYATGSSHTYTTQFFLVIA
jgi:hypothetical protein